MLNSLFHAIIVLNNVKMPTIAGIFNIYEQGKFPAQLSLKSFINSDLEFFA